MTQPGETEGYSLADHVRVIYSHTRRKLFDWVVASNQPVSPEVARRYSVARRGAGARGYPGLATHRRALPAR